MAGERRLLYKHAEEERRDKEAAASRRRSSGNIWGLLGGILATALTGGAAAPWIKGLAYAGGTYLGHKYGVSRSKTDEALTGGLFYQESGPEMMSLIDEEGITSALKGGVGYGFAQYGKQSLAAKIGGEDYVAPKSSGLFDFYNSPIGKYFAPKTTDIASITTGDPASSSFPMQHDSLLKDLPSVKGITNKLTTKNKDTSMIYDRLFEPIPSKIDRKWRG